MSSTHQAAGAPATESSPPIHACPAYPAAARVPVVDVLHGHRVPDPYRWLEEGGAAACEEWLAEQEKLFTTHAAAWPARRYFRDALEDLQRLGGTLVPLATPPVCRGPRRFYLRREATAQLPALVVASDGGGVRTLCDPMAADPEGLTSLAAWRPSWTGRLLAYQLTHRGSETPGLLVLDVGTGRTVDGPLHPDRVTPVAWLPDDSAFYYTAAGSSPAGRCVRLHHIGGDPAADPVVFDTPHPHLAVAASPDGRWLTLSSAPGAQAGNDLYLADLTAPKADPASPALRLIHQGAEEGTSALLKPGPRGLLYAVTDAGAPRGRVCTVDPAHPDREAWRTVIAPGPDELLTACTPLTDPDSRAVRLLTVTTRDGAARLAVHGDTGQKPGAGPGTISNLSAPPDESGEVWFTYTDFITPPAVHRFDLQLARCVPERPDHTPGSAATTRPSPVQTPPRGPGRPVVRQDTYRSEDGTKVGLYLIEPPQPASGARPTLLTAYGGFGALAAPAFSPTIMAWVQAGGVYAVAGVRGGGEHGTAWHEAGSGLNKANCFTDFAAAARHLIHEGITTPDRLAIKGASHAGLVVAVALTRNPDLYAAAVCSDALTDMVRYPHLGLGPLWGPEFGTPTGPEHLKALLSYSPYHRVKPGTRYPATLLTGARTDPRSGAAHIRKFTAALQHATTTEQPVLLRTEADVGHGQRTASRWADLTADTLAFCAAHTGLPVPEEDRGGRG
jgi:prolyl oligopeptidase